MPGYTDLPNPRSDIQYVTRAEPPRKDLMKYTGPRDQMINAKLRKINYDARENITAAHQAIVDTSPGDLDRILLVSDSISAMQVIERTTKLLSRVLSEKAVGNTATIDRLSWAMDVIQADETDHPTGYFGAVHVLGFGQEEEGSPIGSPNAPRALAALRMAWSSIQQDLHWLETQDTEDQPFDQALHAGVLSAALHLATDLIEWTGKLLRNSQREDLNSTVEAVTAAQEHLTTGARFYDHHTRTSYSTLEDLQEGVNTAAPES